MQSVLHLRIIVFSPVRVQDAVVSVVVHSMFTINWAAIIDMHCFPLFYDAVRNVVMM